METVRNGPRAIHVKRCFGYFKYFDHCLLDKYDRALNPLLMQICFTMTKRQNRFFLAPLSIQRKTKEKNGITSFIIHFSIAHLAAQKEFVVYLLFL